MEQTPRFILPVDEEIELCLLAETEAEELFGLIERNRTYLREWLPWVDHETSAEDSRRFIQRGVQNYLSQVSFDLGIFYRHQLAGVISFLPVDWPNRSVEIGYWLGQAFTGHGVMTRACRAMVNYAFRSLQLNRVTIRCAMGNTKSRAIPERLGFTQEGTIREGAWLYDHFVDLVVYGILAREWSVLYPD